MMTPQASRMAPGHRHLSAFGVRWAQCTTGVLLTALAATGAWAQAPAELKARYEAVRQATKDNPFGRDVFLQSTESSDELKGDVFALVDHPYGKLAESLKLPGNWCHVLTLHINTKSCVAEAREAPTQMVVHIGRKFDQPLKDAYQITFAFALKSATPEYFLARMEAPSGPLATRDYRIALEAVPWEGNKSLVHLTYAYGFGMAGKVAMKGYLATLGSGKVGFTVTGRTPDGKADYIDGVRGVVERNTMRYYLAIDAYLGSLRAAAPQQVEQRLKTWFDATEAFPRQLHELDWPEYQTMKRSELARQQQAVR